MGNYIYLILFFLILAFMGSILRWKEYLKTGFLPFYYNSVGGFVVSISGLLLLYHISKGYNDSILVITLSLIVPFLIGITGDVLAYTIFQPYNATYRKEVLGNLKNYFKRLLLLRLPEDVKRFSPTVYRKDLLIYGSLLYFSSFLLYIAFRRIDLLLVTGMVVGEIFIVLAPLKITNKASVFSNNSLLKKP